MLSPGTIISEVHRHADTKRLWLGLEPNDKRCFLVRIGSIGVDDYKTLRRCLRKIANKDRRERAIARRAELDKRLTEIRSAAPSDRQLRKIRRDIIGVADDITELPMKRARQLRLLIARYDRRKAKQEN
jgi:hypothetical protein